MATEKHQEQSEERKTQNTAQEKKNWWENLSSDRKESFLADVRNPLLTNAAILEKWLECPNEKELRHASAALGETRSRIQIRLAHNGIQSVEKMLEARMYSLIMDNALNTMGEDALYVKLSEEFQSDLSQAQYVFSKEQYLRMRNRILWTPDALTFMRKVVRSNDMSPRDSFLPVFPYFTLEIAEGKAQELHGIVNRIAPPSSTQATPTIPGVGRFAGEAAFRKENCNFKFPRSTASQPYEISVKDPDNWDIMVLNGANIGLAHTGNIEENPVPLALRFAEDNGVEAVLMTNPIYIDTLKAAGPSKVGRALLSGIEENVSVMDPDYQPIAKRIFAEHPDDELVTTTAEEKLKDLILGCRKDTHKPKKKPGTDAENPEYLTEVIPMYSGPLYLLGGPWTELLARAMVYWQATLHVKRKLNRIKAELSATLSQEAKKIKQMEKLQAEIALMEMLDEKERDTEVLEDLKSSFERVAAEAAIFYKQVEKLTRFEHRERISNVHDMQWKRFRVLAVAYLAELFETNMPSAKMLNMSSVYVKAGTTRIEVHVPRDLKVTDTRLADFANTYGPRVRRGEMANIAVVCPAVSLNYRTVGREVDADGIRGSCQIAVAPMCVDDQFIRERLWDTVGGNHPMERAVFNEMITPGVMLISCRNGIVSTSPVYLSALAEQNKRPKKQIITVEDQSYINFLMLSDEHIGSRYQERLECNGEFMTVSEVIFASLRAYGYGPKNPPPFHFFMMNDDPIQGQHFPAHRQPHHNQRLPHEFKALVNRVRDEGLGAGAERAKNKSLKRLAYLAQRQDALRGIDYMGDQMGEFCDNFIEANIDLFEGMLLRFLQSRIELKPISAYEKDLHEDEGYDRRDLGAHNYPVSNHVLKTVEGHFSEGPQFARHEYALLRGTPRWAKRRDVLKKLIRGPQYGSQSVAYGTIRAPGGYMWGIDFRNTPAQRVTNWGDPSMVAARTELRRGNISRLPLGIVIVHVFGDKHFYNVHTMPLDILVMVPPRTRTDGFAEMAGGLPPNNTGFMVLSLPAGGPQAGPIILRPFLFDHIRDKIAPNLKRFSWGRSIPKPV